jgi:hypothetical protein
MTDDSFTPDAVAYVETELDVVTLNLPMPDSEESYIVVTMNATAAYNMGKELILASREAEEFEL